MMMDSLCWNVIDGLDIVSKLIIIIRHFSILDSAEPVVGLVGFFTVLLIRFIGGLITVV